MPSRLCMDTTDYAKPSFIHLHVRTNFLKNTIWMFIYINDQCHKMYKIPVVVCALEFTKNILKTWFTDKEGIKSEGIKSEWNLLNEIYKLDYFTSQEKQNPKYCSFNHLNQSRRVCCQACLGAGYTLPRKLLVSDDFKKIKEMQDRNIYTWYMYKIDRVENIFYDLISITFDLSDWPDLQITNNRSIYNIDCTQGKMKSDELTTIDKFESARGLVIKI
jgi:hypothetical protein